MARLPSLHTIVAVGPLLVAAAADAACYCCLLFVLSVCLAPNLLPSQPMDILKWNCLLCSANELNFTLTKPIYKEADAKIHSI